MAAIADDENVFSTGLPQVNELRGRPPTMMKAESSWDSLKVGSGFLRFGSGFLKFETRFLRFEAGSLSEEFKLDPKLWIKLQK